MVFGNMSLMLEVNQSRAACGGAVDHIVFSSVLQVNAKGSDALNGPPALLPDKNAFISPKQWPYLRQGNPFDVIEPQIPQNTPGEKEWSRYERYG